MTGGEGESESCSFDLSLAFFHVQGKQFALLLLLQSQRMVEKKTKNSSLLSGQAVIDYRGAAEFPQTRYEINLLEMFH